MLRAGRPRARPDASLVAVQIAADTDARAWDEFVATRASANGYHWWAWRSVFASAFGHESIYLMARTGDRVAGLLPLVEIRSLVFGRSLTSLPFLNYGGVLTESAEAAQALATAAADLGRTRRCDHVELRHIDRQFPELPCKQHKVTMKLPLRPGLWEQLDRKVRNQVRKAQKSDLVSEHGGSPLLADFYRVFARNMRDLGTPVHGRRFFESVMQAFPERTRVHIVRLKGAPVAAGITFQSGGALEVPWASSIRDYNSLCPNHLLYWSIIEGAVESGVEVLDFGRSTPHEGTYKFKEQWGAEPVPLHWEYPLLKGKLLPNASPTNPKFQLAVRMWKKLPLSIATRVGPSIVRAIP